MFAQRGSPRNDAGQILLVVILVIIIASTIGLSLASRSITNLRTSTEEAESQKALSAAEAGIERAIQGKIPVEAGISLSGDTNLRFDVTSVPVENSSFLLNGGSLIPKNEGTDIWFVEHDDNGNPDYSRIVSTNFLNLYWGISEEECPAAIQAIVISRKRNTGEIKSYRYAYDSCSSRGNNFTTAIKGSFPQDYDNDEKTDIEFKNRTPDNSLAQGVSDIVFVRVIPLYKDTIIGVDTCNPSDKGTDKGNGCKELPTQGYIVSSTGTSGQTKRKLTYFKGYQQTYLPYVSYGLFVAK